MQHFGREGGKYTVSTEVKDPGDNTSLVKTTRSYSSEKDVMHDYYGFDVLFNYPVRLKAGKAYKIISLIKGPRSWYGEEGKRSVECNQVQFTFSTFDGNNNGTDHTRGQFPAFLFN